MLISAACSSGGGRGDAGPPPTVIIAAPASVPKEASAQLFATVVDAAPGVRWAVEGGDAYGTVTPDGLYTAPSRVPGDPVVVRAMSTADARGTATATIRVTVGDDLYDETLRFNKELSPVTAKANTFSGGQRSVAVRGSVVYAVWNDDSSGNDDVYLSVSLDRGETFGPAVRVNDDWLSGGERPQLFPSVGVDGSGRAVIAWLDGRHYTETDPRFDVYVATATVNAGGVQVGPNQRLSQAGTPDTLDSSVALAVDQGGNIYVVWADGSAASHTDIMLTKGVRNTSGLFQFAPPVPVNQYGPSDQGRPAIAVDTGGNVLVAWHSWQPVSGQIDVNWEVYWRRGRFDATGAIVWATDESRVNLLTEADQISPSVALDSNGTAHIVWSQQIGLTGRRKLYFAKSSSADLSVVENVDVMRSESDQNFPSLVVAGAEITIAVADNRRCNCEGDQTTDLLKGNQSGVTDIYVLRSIDGGANFRQPESVLNTDDESSTLRGRASVAVDDVGRVYAVWADGRNETSNSGLSQAFFGRVE